MDTNVDGFGDYTYSSPDAPADTTSSSNVFTDFFSAARERVSAALTPMQQQQSSGPSVGSQLFEAIYQYGRGQVDQAREKAVGAFLMTSEGKKIQQSGIQQTISQYAPFIVLALLGVFALGIFARR